MINLKKKIKKLSAGITAGLCALTVIGGSITSGGITATAAMSTENTAFPTADEVIAEATTLLGSPYGWGFKGYTGVYYQGSYSPLSLEYVRKQGVDCSGLLYYTLAHLGYSTSGFSWNNPVPVDTPHWLSVNDKCTITYMGVTSKIDVEKSNIPCAERPYWERTDGSTITPGSIVIADNLNGEDHSWIYMGEFDSRNDVISYLKSIGVNESYISSRTVGDGNGDGGTHWRIESNGSEGCVINNRTDGKKASAMNMYSFRVTQADVSFSITKVLSTNNSIKISGVSSIDGSKAVYGVYTDKSCTNKVGEIAIGADGTGSIRLPNKQYYVKEIKAPTGYDLSPDIVPLKANSNVNVEEDISSGSITISKTAEDGIIADREFRISWTDGGSTHTKNAKTDSSGIAVFDGLHVYDLSTNTAISYTVSEVSTDTRYVTPKAQNITLTGSNAGYSASVGFENILKKGDISIIKHSDDNEDNIETLEAGAEFEVYLKSAGSYNNAEESERDCLITDENGYARTKQLPYGTYTVHQTKTVDDAEFVSDFDVNIIENGKTYEYILNNKPFKSYIHISKVDAETGNIIPYEGAGFRIYDSNDNVVSLGTDTFYTNNEGFLITPESLGYGEYSLVEVQAPMGYVLDSTPVPFTVNADSADEENGVNIIRVTKADTAQKGRISVTKHGEIFQTAAVTEDDIYIPVFEERGIAGAEFEISAAEDIITPDGTVRANAGDVVADLITDENGYAESGELYLGKYEIREVSAPYGYVAGSEAKEVELVCGDQDTAVTDTVNTTFINDYQGINIRLEKAMEHDELFGIGVNDEYMNVEFGLYAAEDITAADGTFIPENGLISQISPGEDMSATISEKLPFAHYYVQEIATDEHYVLSGEKYLVNFEYMGQDVAAVDIDCGTFTNDLKRGSISGEKLNEHGDPLGNALFGLFPAGETTFTAGNAYLTAISDEDGSFVFDNIPCGKYIVREIAAPTGYILSEEEHIVNIAEDGDIVEITAENNSVPRITHPAAPPTGDPGKSHLGLVMLIIGMTGLLYVSIRSRKKNADFEMAETEFANQCPDFIEGENNDKKE